MRSARLVAISLLASSVGCAASVGPVRGDPCPRHGVKTIAFLGDDSRWGRYVAGTVGADVLFPGDSWGGVALVTAGTTPEKAIEAKPPVADLVVTCSAGASNERIVTTETYRPMAGGYKWDSIKVESVPGYDSSAGMDLVVYDTKERRVVARCGAWDKGLADDGAIRATLQKWMREFLAAWHPLPKEEHDQLMGEHRERLAREETERTERARTTLEPGIGINGLVIGRSTQADVLAKYGDVFEKTPAFLAYPDNGPKKSTTPDFFFVDGKLHEIWAGPGCTDLRLEHEDGARPMENPEDPALWATAHSSEGVDRSRGDGYEILQNVVGPRMRIVKIIINHRTRTR
jgi:hypothetical protein